MAKKKKPHVYHPFETLRPMALDPDLEGWAQKLYDFANKGSSSLWGGLSQDRFREDAELRKSFYTLSHAGMRAAQHELVELVVTKTPISGSQKMLLHGISDSIAWQFLNNQLCYARRFYKGNKPVDLNQSNFESVVLAAEQQQARDPGSFSLISDLTTFIQIGDLLTVGSDGRLSVAEVKEGRKNHELMEFMRFMSNSGCPRAFQYFAEQHGESGVKQLMRMQRQALRMGHIQEILTTGRSQDPDTNDRIHIPEKTLFIGNWDAELNKILEDSESRGWALDVVDGCLFIASYEKEAISGQAHSAFNLWFDDSGGTPDCPRATLMSTLTQPLALPIFNWSISEKHKFDILFGRKNVCVGINVSMLLIRLQSVGMRVREATNREFSQAEQRGFPMVRHKGKGWFVGNGVREMPLMDGIYMRVLFHSQRPVSTIQAILNAADELRDGQDV